MANKRPLIDPASLRRAAGDPRIPQVYQEPEPPTGQRADTSTQPQGHSRADTKMIAGHYGYEWWKQLEAIRTSRQLKLPNPKLERVTIEAVLADAMNLLFAQEGLRTLEYVPRKKTGTR